MPRLQKNERAVNSLLDRKEDHVRRVVHSHDDALIDNMIDQCRDARQSLRLTQAEVAAEVNCTVRSIIDIENHKRMPTLSRFARYASACGFTLYLMENDS